MELVQQGIKHAYLWGWAAYTDIFPGTPMRYSEYCIEIDNPRWNKKDHSDASGEIAFDTPSCPVHNCYDGNCAGYKAKVQQLGDSLHAQ